MSLILLWPACGVMAAPSDAPAAVETASPLPYYSEITRLISPLEYSGLYALIKPDVTLSIDFERRTWTLNRIREFSKDGAILLEKGRYGLCSDLSAYVYDRIKNLLGDRYDVKFGNVREDGFFVEDLSNHVVLLFRDKTDAREYLIDPSFQKYGEVRDFPEYKVLGVNESLSFLKDRFGDVTYRVDEAMPLLIKDDVLLSFSVESINGQFDPDNFVFVVAADYRHKGQGPNLVLLGKHNGQPDKYEDREQLEQYMNPEDLSALDHQMARWFVRFLKQ